MSSIWCPLTARVDYSQKVAVTLGFRMPYYRLYGCQFLWKSKVLRMLFYSIYCRTIIVLTVLPMVNIVSDWQKVLSFPMTHHARSEEL